MDLTSASMALIDFLLNRKASSDYNSLMVHLNNAMSLLIPDKSAWFMDLHDWLLLRYTDAKLLKLGRNSKC